MSPFFIWTQRFFLESNDNDMHGRSSDSFPLAGAFPEAGSSGNGVWCMPATLCETYSSGTVQDLHLIPF